MRERRRGFGAGGRMPVIAAAVGLVLLGAFGTVGAAAHQRAFESADAAVGALVDAAKAGDVDALLAILGPEARELIVSGDPVADRHARERFVARAGERTYLARVGDDFAVLSIGNDDWPFPIPLTKDDGAWTFDTRAGKEEVLNRRIGRNELYAIQICQEYVTAQRDYAARMAAAGGPAEYAQRVHSTPGTHDGLYWEAASDGDLSPIGPLMATATAEGYGPGKGGAARPFHGYLYRILRMQGPHAPGGRRSYVRDGKMTDGFALVAYPAAYGSTGVMTFIVNQQGVVFEKDLGPRTAQLGHAMTMYDPDPSWHPAE